MNISIKDGWMNKQSHWFVPVKNHPDLVLWMHMVRCGVFVVKKCKMKISQIVAVAKNGVIGNDNKLIWHMPSDMKHFMQTTKGHCIITGRKNYESIPEKFRPLKDRTNFVITRQANYQAPGAIVVGSIEEAIEAAKKTGESECFIIGGGEIFKQTLHLTDKIYYTEIHQDFNGNVFYPKLDSTWKEETSVHHKSDEKNPYDYSFLTFVKVI